MSDCYKCEYRSRVTFTCDYILYAGTARGCCAENCDKFRQRKGAEISPNIIEIIKLYWRGYSDRAIAKELGISRYVVRAWRISCGYEPNERSIKKPPRCDGIEAAFCWNSKQVQSGKI